MTKALKIAPSILAADFARLGDEIRTAETAGADQIHIDVMDGHFVPNISLGIPVIKSIRSVTDLPFDVHLMISNPARYLEALAEAGSNMLTVHIENSIHIHRTIHSILDMGLKAGIAINPGTPINTLSEIIGDVDLVLVMTVNPGYGGQTFIERSITKIEQVRALLDQNNSEADLSVDGGIGPGTAERAIKAGANVLVAGNAIFRAKEGVEAAIANLKLLGG
jgi:ribulose-phosphate 3-epimerase